MKNQPEHRIALRPVGDIRKDVLQYIKDRVGETFRCSVAIVEPMELPERAYHPKRSQYESTPILHNLRGFEGSEEFTRVLGIARSDLFAYSLNFIFGEACPGKGTAVIALSRLEQEFYSLPDNEPLFLHRTIKEAVHELGHLYGMRHCSDSRCVMFFSMSLHDTDVKSEHFCQAHSRILLEQTANEAA